MTDSNFKVANIVTVAHLNEELNLQAIFDLLVIIYFDYKVGTKLAGMGRETVPFFGINGAIVGMRYQHEMRGIIRTGGHLESLIGIDLQCFDKNINLKLSKAKIQLTGAKSEEMAVGATTLLLQHLEMLFNHYTHAKNLTHEIQISTIEWLIKTVLYVEDEKLCVKTYDDVKDKFSEIPQTVDLQLAKWISMYSCEYSKPGEGRAFIDKIYRVMSHIRSSPPFLDTPQMTSYKICNGVYNFTLGQKISLIQTSQAMIKEGYKVSYHNWSSGKKMRIAILIEDDSPSGEEITPISLDGEEDNEDIASTTSGDDIVFKNKKIKAHRFTINQSGSIRQISPTSYQQAHETYLKIYNDLKRVIS